MSIKLNILHELAISQERSDSIIGGMLRIEAEKKTWKDFVKGSLKLANTHSETNFVWFLVGSKAGMAANLDNIIVVPYKKNKPFVNDPSVS